MFKDLEYSGPPELFSMYACLFGDDLVMSIPTDVLTQNEERLRLMRHTYMTSFGQSPHPTVLLSELRSHVSGAVQVSAGSAWKQGQACQKRAGKALMAKPAATKHVGVIKK